MDVFVEGVPVPQGSKNAFVVGKEKPRAVVVDVKQKPLQEWRARIAAAVSGHRFDAHVPVRVDLGFYLPRGKTVKRALPTTKPDVDKLTRAVFDALTDALVVVDDSQIVTGTQIKRYADDCPPGVRIRVMEHSNEQ